VSKVQCPGSPGLNANAPGSAAKDIADQSTTATATRQAFIVAPLPFSPSPLLFSAFPLYFAAAQRMACTSSLG